MLVTFGPNVSNLPVPLLERLLDGVADIVVGMINNIYKIRRGTEMSNQI